MTTPTRRNRRGELVAIVLVFMLAPLVVPEGPAIRLGVIHPVFDVCGYVGAMAIAAFARGFRSSWQSRAK
jgi:hypothetical protein